jgi:hypothetical protein
MTSNQDIMRAIEENALETIQMLLAMDPQITLLFFDEQGLSPLDLAVAKEHEEMAMLLERHIRENEGAGVAEKLAHVHWQYTAVGRHAIQQEIREETDVALKSFNAQHFFF